MVDIYIENKEKIPADILSAMKAVITKAVTDSLPNHKLEVSLTITDDDEIRALNAQYRGKDTPTDVLSFPMYEFDTPDTLTLLGDIVISAQRAAEQAQEYNHSLKREMCFLAAHGTLHLLGYDHENNEDERLEMEALQDEILNSLEITREL